MTSPIQKGLLTTGLTAGLCTILSGFSVATPNMVTFGDSIIANPSPAQTGQEQDFCAHDPNNIPAQVSADLGLENRDWSCAGATAAPVSQNISASGTTAHDWNTIDNQVSTASDAGLMDNDTEVVLITVGFNDTYYIPENTDWTYAPFRAEVRDSLENGTPLPQPPHPLQPVWDAQKENWDREVDASMETINTDAPNSEVVFSGYPSITNEYGMSCIVKTPLNNTVPVYISWVPQSEQNANAWMAEAADRHDGVYVDNRAVTAKHNQCAGADSMFSGTIDFGTPGQWNLSNHPTQDGIDLMSNNIVDTIEGNPEPQAKSSEDLNVADRDAQPEVQQPIYDGPPIIPGFDDELPTFAELDNTLQATDVVVEEDAPVESELVETVA